MTPEELLKPRYKVIAPYPHIELDQHKVGDIISPFGMGFVHPGKVKEQYDSFPHLFKKLQWWEDRRIDEVPEYVKCIKTPDQQIMPGMVLKVKWVSGWGTSGRHVVVLNTGCFEPATEAEYLEYIKQKEG